MPDSAQKLFGVRVHRFEYGGLSFDITGIADIDALVDSISQEQFQKDDERLPYWAELWPASKALAQYIIREKPFNRGMTLDIGCGLGLTSLAAAATGAKVVATDISVEALRLCARNFKDINSPRIVCCDWKNLPFTRGIQYIMASDVLYEERFHKPIRDMLNNVLACGGMALFSDPNRAKAVLFFKELEKAGFSATRYNESVHISGKQVSVSIYKILRGN